MKITRTQLKQIIKEELEEAIGHKFSRGELDHVHNTLKIAIEKALLSLRGGSAVERERAVRDAFEPAMEEAMKMLHSDE